MTSPNRKRLRQIEAEADAYVHSVVSNMPASDKRMSEIRRDQKADTTCSRLMKYCIDGWPESEKIGPYWAIASELSVLSVHNRAGTVVRCADTPRSYVVNTDQGEMRRNRRQLRERP